MGWHPRIWGRCVPQLGVFVPPHALRLPPEPITRWGHFWCDVTVRGQGQGMEGQWHPCPHFLPVSLNSPSPFFLFPPEFLPILPHFHPISLSHFLFTSNPISFPLSPHFLPIFPNPHSQFPFDFLPIFPSFSPNSPSFPPCFSFPLFPCFVPISPISLPLSPYFPLISSHFPLTSSPFPLIPLPNFHFTSSPFPPHFSPMSSPFPLFLSHFPFS